MTHTIREAEAGDSALIVECIRSLADFEHLFESATITEEAVRRDFFCLRRANAVFIEADGATCGFAVYYYTYSTFAGKPTLFIEDLFVKLNFRNRGFGRNLFLWLCGKAAEEGCARVEWNVLAWNSRALAFYRSMGGSPREDWETWRMELPQNTMHTTTPVGTKEG
jgi:GNAT superfamily N-acetyltransferase